MTDDLEQEREHARRMAHVGSTRDVFIKYAIAIVLAIALGFTLRWWLR